MKTTMASNVLCHVNLTYTQTIDKEVTKMTTKPNSTTRSASTGLNSKEKDVNTSDSFDGHFQVTITQYTSGDGDRRSKRVRTAYYFIS